MQQIVAGLVIKYYGYLTRRVTWKKEKLTLKEQDTGIGD